ncbi:IclR family transcriptional regulator [Natronorarus salvus]|uniref:IclR family transcriptional regulator n=1 Tax=Natronorarus salvus TaxID=3117733 RepID=UPI002F261EA0
MASDTISRVKTTETSFEIVNALLRSDGARIDELAERLDLTSSTIHRHLSTLREYGYVARDGDVYRVGFQFLTIGGQLRRQLPAYSSIKRKVDHLAEQTDERAQFIVEENGERVYVYTSTGENSVYTGAATGGRAPIHSSAAGKAILATLPPYRRRRLVDSLPLERTGPNTITDRDRLREELREIRARGYAFNLEESTAGVNAMGAAIHRPDGTVIGALSVSGPATRLKDEPFEEQLPDLVLAATNEIELQIKYSVA